MSKLAKALTAAAGNAGDSLYVEDVFSTYLYEGTGATQTITNGIDLDGEGGMTWIKCRNTAFNNVIFDTERGAPNALLTNTTDQNISFYTDSLTSFNSDGFTLGADTTSLLVNNGSNRDYCSWTFRKAKKFFDVVTYTGNSTAGRTVSHNLGSTPAVIIVKKTSSSSSSNWYVYHSSLGSSAHILLNTTAAADAASSGWNNTNPTSTEFTLGNNANVNASGESFVAYLFASDAGGFGDDENIIKCGSYTGDGGAGTTEVNLGFEPQWILVKATSAADSWFIIDNMRGWATESNTSNDAVLLPNTSGAESTGGYLDITATGFKTTLFSNVNVSGRTYAYVAIRRPMKTPESGTEVFAVDTGTGTGSLPQYISNFPVDMAIITSIDAVESNYNTARLTGAAYLATESTAAISATNANFSLDFNNGWFEAGGTNRVSWMFKRATGFFDVVATTGASGVLTLNHNLGVPPEFLISKRRNGTSHWYADQVVNYLRLNTDGGNLGTPVFNNFTATTFNADAGTFSSGETYITYLFATLAGVSKVGSYTGTGSNVDVDCGFSAGARFILIKRSDSTGDWYVYDSERGIVAGNDPYLLLNTTAAEVTNTDYIDPLSSGFTVTSTAPAGLNASGGTYIFLAIA
jgi:hypothetical protein